MPVTYCEHKERMQFWRYPGPNRIIRLFCLACEEKRKEAMLPVGELVEKAREKKGITALQLATMSGMHPLTIQRIEMGRNSPTFDTLNRLVDVMSMSWTEFLHPDLDPMLIDLMKQPKYLEDLKECWKFYKQMAVGMEVNS